MWTPCAGLTAVHSRESPQRRLMKPVSFILPEVAPACLTRAGSPRVTWRSFDHERANRLWKAELSLWPPLKKGIHEFKWKPTGTEAEKNGRNKSLIHRPKADCVMFYGIYSAFRQILRMDKWGCGFLFFLSRDRFRAKGEGESCFFALLFVLEHCSHS